MLITFLLDDGGTRTVEAEPDSSVMEAATSNGIPGIVADCGGFMSCATCHVHVEPRWMKALGEPSEDEVALLEMAIDPDATSRLLCQISLDEPLDGLTVRVPRAQF